MHKMTSKDRAQTSGIMIRRLVVSDRIEQNLCWRESKAWDCPLCTKFGAGKEVYMLSVEEIGVIRDGDGGGYGKGGCSIPPF